jgi:hypothetical protein
MTEGAKEFELVKSKREKKTEVARIQYKAPQLPNQMERVSLLESLPHACFQRLHIHSLVRAQK